MDGVRSGASTRISSLPDEVVVKIATFCKKSDGLNLYRTCRGCHQVLQEEVRKVQIFLISQVAERIENTLILLTDKNMRMDVKREKDLRVQEIREATSLEGVIKSSKAFMQCVGKYARGEHEVLIHPFYSVTDEKLDRKHHFMPSYLERKIRQMVISIVCGLVLGRPCLENALRLMGEGKFDHTEESSKVEEEGTSCLLFGLAQAIIYSKQANMPLFLDVIRRIPREDLQEEILSFGIKHYLSSSRTNREFLNLLIDEEFFFSLSLNIQLKLIEEIYWVDQGAALSQALRSSNIAIKRRVLDLHINGNYLYQKISQQPESLFQALDLARTIPVEERIGREFGVIDRLEKICRPHQADFRSFELSWELSFRLIYRDERGRIPCNFLRAGLLKILLIDEGWGREPTQKMVEDSWRFLDEFPALHKGICAYILFIQALSYVQDEESCKEVSKIVSEAIQGIKSEKERGDFVRLFLLEKDTLKNHEFLNYEEFLEQIQKQ